MDETLMLSFAAYATNFDAYPRDAEAFAHLAPLLERIVRVEFAFTVTKSLKNNAQMTSDFDDALEKRLFALGADVFDLELPSDIPQELDFAFKFDGHKVAVEVEKANREKILRDILKCHMYLHSGADFAVIALPKNYPHRRDVWDLFDWGVKRYRECRAYGFGSAEVLGKIVLLGFEQFEASTNRSLCEATRGEMRSHALSMRTSASSV